MSAPELIGAGWPADRGPIVCLGAHIQALFVEVERVPAEGETVRGYAVSEPVDGGKSTCQAVAAARLGAPVTFVSLVGSDERGRWWRSQLEREGIDTRWLRTAQGATDTGVVLLPPSRAPAIVSVTALSSRFDVAMVHDATDAIRGGSMLLCPLEAPASTVKEAFRVARAAAVLTMLNPAPADDVDEELLRLADIIVANEHEAALIVGKDGDPSELAARLAARLDPAIVVVTAGESGAAFATGRQPVVHVPAPRVEVVDTTGAGDAFLGAFAVALGRGAAVEDAVRTGVAVGSLSVTRSGSIASYPTAVEAEAALAAPIA
jgi:ribokinase